MLLLLLGAEGHEGQPPGSDGQGGGGDGPAEAGEAEESGTGEPAAQHELLSDQNRGGDCIPTAHAIKSDSNPSTRSTSSSPDSAGKTV